MVLFGPLRGPVHSRCIMNRTAAPPGYESVVARQVYYEFWSNYEEAVVVEE